MNKSMRNASLMLLVIFLAAGPLLLVVPSVNAVPNKPDPVMVVFYLDESDPDAKAIWSPENYQFPDDWIQIGNTYKITIESVNENGYISLRLLVPNKYVHLLDDDPMPLSIVQYGLFCDFNNDGVVDGQDVKLVANANKDKYYVWEYDVHRDGTIDQLDVNVVNSQIGETIGWTELASSPYQDPISGKWYLEVESVPHFSGFGIRR